MGDAWREVEPHETYLEAARRELLEETGIATATIGPQLGERRFVLQMPDGEHVEAEERFYLVHTDDPTISDAGWTELEMEVMGEHRWWSLHDLITTTETVYPENVSEMLEEALALKDR